jgi:hypothetical protein
MENNGEARHRSQKRLTKAKATPVPKQQQVVLVRERRVRERRIRERRILRVDSQSRAREVGELEQGNSQ